MTRRQQHGWVVRYSVRSPRGKTMTVYWSGPDRSWGQHFSPLCDHTGTLSIEVAVFSTRNDARAAIKATGLTGCVPIALERALDRVENWEVAA